MPLVQLIYTSEYASALTLQQARELAQDSRCNNAALGITGVLMFGHGRFLQLLEGGAGPVNALFLRIAADPRHQQVELLRYRPIVARSCSAWAMGHVDAASLGADLLLRYGTGDRFEPHLMSDDQAESLLLESMARMDETRHVSAA